MTKQAADHWSTDRVGCFGTEMVEHFAAKQFEINHLATSGSYCCKCLFLIQLHNVASGLIGMHKSIGKMKN